ncbi:UDP-N-acetylmuramate--L-alanine ligase [Lachnospiraceae bacterium NE2001]|nr:UDP-N-acetylmuramate--L-alanine ligase [Lachnospiraceae bacterium NE2001]
MYKVDFNKPCHAHFIGIGGVSMSGLAEILKNDGFTVSGSDMKESDTTKSLEAGGIKVFYGQVASNISDDIDFVVYTAAIHPDNEEFMEVERRNIPLLTRAQLLGQLMDNYKYSVAVAGTHGKTTTTSMMSYIMLEAGTDPTISIGGHLNEINGNIRVGNSDYFVTEACEYTNSYHEFRPFASIILNVDNDHLDFFKNIENIAASFATFATKTRDGGALIVNGDMKYRDQVVNAVADRNIKVFTFGKEEGNDFVARNIRLNELGQASYQLVINGEDKGEIKLSVMGEHNAVNSLSAIAASLYIGISLEDIKEGLMKCHSADRRFQYKGTTENGVTIIDDYAHHPTEISASLAVANAVKKSELWVAFQPHTYSRTKAHLQDFAKALSVSDHVLLADIYAAREIDDGSVSSKDLENELTNLGCDAHYLGTFEDIKKYFEKFSKNNDMLITMGAGNIDSLGMELLKK